MGQNQGHQDKETFGFSSFPGRGVTYVRISVSGIGIYAQAKRLSDLGEEAVGFLDKDLDHIGEEAIGFYGFLSFPDRGMTCIFGFPFPDQDHLGGCWPFAAPTIVEAAETQPPDGLVFPGKVSQVQYRTRCWAG